MSRSLMVFELGEIAGMIAFPIIVIVVVIKLRKYRVPPIENGSSHTGDGFWYFMGHNDGMNDGSD